MNCHRIVSMLSAYVDSELTGAEMLEIRRHLSDCAECEKEHQAVLFTKILVSRLRTVAPKADFVATLVSNLAVVQITPGQRFLNSLWRCANGKMAPVAASLAAAGVALVVLSAGGLDGLNSAEDQLLAIAPSGSHSVVHYIPDVHVSPSSMASSRPLRVANDSASLTSANYQFASFSGLK